MRCLGAAQVLPHLSPSDASSFSHRAGFVTSSLLPLRHQGHRRRPMAARRSLMALPNRLLWACKYARVHTRHQHVRSRMRACTHAHTYQHAHDSSVAISSGGVVLVVLELERMTEIRHPCHMPSPCVARRGMRACACVLVLACLRACVCELDEHE